MDYPLRGPGWPDLELRIRHREVWRDRLRSGEIDLDRSFDLPIRHHALQVRVIPCHVWTLSFGTEFVKHGRGAPNELSALGVGRARSRSPGPTSRDRARSGEIQRARSRSSDLPTQFRALQVRVIHCDIWILRFVSEFAKHGRGESIELSAFGDPNGEI